MNDDDPILVSYHDSIVRSSNLKTLDEDNWLDDNIITFAFEYLQHNHHYQEDLFTFVSPPVVQLLKMSDNVFAQQLLESIDFRQKQFLILPINDNSRAESVGGSHWSLLLVAIREKSIYHFDSMSPSNTRSATIIQRLLQSFLNQKRSMIEADCPQQINGFDCGLYVIVFVEEFCRFIDENEKTIEFDERFFKQFSETIKTRVTPEYIQERRKQLRHLIKSMVQKAEA